MNAVHLLERWITRYGPSQRSFVWNRRISCSYRHQGQFPSFVGDRANRGHQIRKIVVALVGSRCSDEQGDCKDLCSHGNLLNNPVDMSVPTRAGAAHNSSSTISRQPSYPKPGPRQLAMPLRRHLACRDRWLCRFQELGRLPPGGSPRLRVTSRFRATKSFLSGAEVVTYNIWQATSRRTPTGPECYNACLRGHLRLAEELGTWPLSVSAEVSFKVATRTAWCIRFLIVRFSSSL